MRRALTHILYAHCARCTGARALTHLRILHGSAGEEWWVDATSQHAFCLATFVSRFVPSSTPTTFTRVVPYLICTFAAKIYALVLKATFRPHVPAFFFLPSHTSQAVKAGVAFPTAVVRRRVRYRYHAHRRTTRWMMMNTILDNFIRFVRDASAEGMPRRHFGTALAVLTSYSARALRVDFYDLFTLSLPHTHIAVPAATTPR